MRDIDFADALVCIAYLRGGQEVVVAVLHDRGGKMTDELEDPRRIGLPLAQGVVVHEQVANHAAAIDLTDPLREFFGSEWPLLPGAIPKPQDDILAKPMILEQKLEA